MRSAIDQRQEREAVNARCEWRNTAVHRVVRRTLSERRHLSRELTEAREEGLRTEGKGFQGVEVLGEAH